jgi:hypothetical protein
VTGTLVAVVVGVESLESDEQLALTTADNARVSRTIEPRRIRLVAGEVRTR